MISRKLIFFKLCLLCLLSFSARSEILNEEFFINFNSNYCLANEYNCKFDGSVSPYSLNDYLEQRYKFIELYFAKQNFETAAFEFCGSRSFNASLTVNNKLNDHLKFRNGCINFAFLKDTNINSLIEERYTLFYNPDRSIYNYSEAMPGYIFTIGYPQSYYQGTGEGYNNLGVHFFINLMNKNNIDSYCTNKSPIKSSQLPSTLKRILNSDNINEVVGKIKDDYNVFYRVLVRDLANFMPNMASTLPAECIYIRKNSKVSNRTSFIFEGINIIN